MPRQMNPAEFLLEMMNIDFASHQEGGSGSSQRNAESMDHVTECEGNENTHDDYLEERRTIYDDDKTV